MKDSSTLSSLTIFDLYKFQGSGELFTSEKSGSDETGDGTEQKPFKTIARALRHAGQEPFPTIQVDGKSEDKVQCFVKNPINQIDSMANSFS